MTALLHDVPRSGRRSRQAGGCDGGLQKQLIGSVPPPLRRWMADRLPANHPLLLLHDPLREDETLPERQRQRPAARSQPLTALDAAPEPTGLAGSGRICSLRTDHLRHVEPDRASHGPWTPPLVVAQHHHLGTSMPSGGGVHTINASSPPNT